MSLELRGMEGKRVVQHTEEQDRGMRGSSFFTQCRVLTRKNAFLAMRNWKGTAGQLLAPVAIVVLLIIFQQVANSVLSNHRKHCNIYMARPCVTLTICSSLPPP